MSALRVRSSSDPQTPQEQAQLVVHTDEPLLNDAAAGEASASSSQQRASRGRSRTFDATTPLARLPSAPTRSTSTSLAARLAASPPLTARASAHHAAQHYSTKRNEMLKGSFSLLRQVVMRVVKWTRGLSKRRAEKAAAKAAAKASAAAAAASSSSPPSAAADAAAPAQRSTSPPSAHQRHASPEVTSTAAAPAARAAAAVH